MSLKAAAAILIAQILSKIHKILKASPPTLTFRSRITLNTIAKIPKEIPATSSGTAKIVANPCHRPEATTTSTFCAVVVTASVGLYLECMSAAPMAAKTSAKTDRMALVLDDPADDFLGCGF